MTQTELEREVEVLREAFDHLAESYVAVLSPQAYATKQAIKERYLGQARADVARGKPEPPVPQDVKDEARDVLRQLKERMAKEDAEFPPLAVKFEPPSGAEAEEARRAAEQFSIQFRTGSAMAVPDTGPQRIRIDGTNPTLALVNRLLWLLDLTPEVRGLVESLAKWPSDADSLMAFADWCEENACAEAGERFRRLVPKSGDVLVMKYPQLSYQAATEARESLQDVGQKILEHLSRHDIEVFILAIPEQYDLAFLDPSTMRSYGWVRQEEADRWALEEREACAEIAEAHLDYYGRHASLDVAEAIRARSNFGEAPAL